MSYHSELDYLNRSEPISTQTVTNGIIEFTGPYTGTYFILDGDDEFQAQICDTDGYTLDQAGFNQAFFNNDAEWYALATRDESGSYRYVQLDRP